MTASTHDNQVLVKSSIEDTMTYDDIRRELETKYEAIVKRIGGEH
jgi:hypothetical protein